MRVSAVCGAWGILPPRLERQVDEGRSPLSNSYAVSLVHFCDCVRTFKFQGRADACPLHADWTLTSSNTLMSRSWG